jgi:hypothetical protein
MDVRQQWESVIHKIMTTEGQKTNLTGHMLMYKNENVDVSVVTDKEGN